ncbi:MAG: DUF3078 domain-containing protein [Paludibacteraceae bacterium]|nr:DUF3078 domain-containing protein [Paludibacteraceae bacterium]MBN2786798.1 DUF3078 domain-containing protein [Paludibacteraceae bacterium]
MKKKGMIFISALAVCQFAFAQITEAEKKVRDASTVVAPTDTTAGSNWKKGGVVGLNFAQAAFQNWAAGGENSIALNGLVSVYANYKKGNSSWDNMLDLGYGILKQGNADGFMKTDDKVDFSSKYGRMATKYWYYAALLNLKTQMTPGYNYPNDSVAISNLLAPGYVILAVGMDYKPAISFSAFIAPLTGKVTIVNDPVLSSVGAYGVDSGKVFKNEFGGYIRLMYNRDFFNKTVSVLSKLDLFTNYLHNPENVDVSWENIIGFKINKYISATITAQLVYDDDIKAINSNGIQIGPKVQLKEVLGIGFNYKF